MVFDISSRAEPRLFALPPGRPFFDDLVASLLAETAGDVSRLPRMRIFVPSRRAVRSLKESFARQSAGMATLLPRITAVADLDEEDALTDTVQRSADPLPPSPSAICKRLKLAGFYRDAMSMKEGEGPSLASALGAASVLSQTSDQLSEYGIDQARLDRLAEAPVMEGLAEHWRDALRILKVVSDDWPEWLKAAGLLDARARRASLLDSVADGLAEDTQSELIVAAGFLGTSPSSQRFLRKVAALPRGAVVLPAFDRGMTDREWAAIEAPHPQSAYKELLAEGFGGVERSHVVDLPYGDDEAGRRRREFLSLALMPAEATDGWASRFAEMRKRPDAARALEGLQIAVARTPDEEADFIALALRETLETPGKTAFLVTADRILGRRVAGKLAGWGIEVDDSGGFPLSGSYRATFMRLIAKVMAKPNDPAALAGLVHHQLFGLGMSAQKRRPLVQSFDLFLRGRTPREGWGGLSRSLEDDWRPMPKGESGRADRMLHELSSVFAEVQALGGSVGDMLRCHVQIAERLAATDTESGAGRLFRFEDGEVLEPHLRELLAHADLLGETDLADYPDVFDALLQGPVVRPPGGQHPRLAILGILEARLQTADLVIVGGLQEGVWPGDAAVDPFFSRAMRQDLGMPSPEAEIGRVAHDFLDFAAAPNVLLTRSERQGRSPAKPSRFMVRLESFLDVLDPERAFDAAPRLRSWVRARFEHDGAARPAAAPAPRPDPALRPRSVSISKVGTWLRDPYAIYAEQVLNLRPLAPYGETFGLRERGTMLHKLFEEFANRFVDGLPEDPEAVLRAELPQLLERFDMPVRQRLLNSRFIERGIAAFCAFEARAREHGGPLGTEARGSVELNVVDEPFSITGVADRIDRYADGVHIIDYKLGGSASLKQDKAFSPQLFLLALMMEKGTFETVVKMPVRRLSFVRLNGEEDVFVPSKGKKQRHIDEVDLPDALRSFEEDLTAFLKAQFEASPPMPSQVHPFTVNSAGDYDELARRGEWNVAGGSGDE